MHLLDLPNFSAFGSVKEVNSKLIGMINDYENVFETDVENNIIENVALQASQKFPIYVDLRNTDEIAVSSLHIRITDRFNNLLHTLTNVQLTLHFREKPATQDTVSVFSR